MDFVTTPIFVQNTLESETNSPPCSLTLSELFKDAEKKWKKAHINDLLHNLDRISLETLEHQHLRQTRKQNLASLTKEFIDLNPQAQENRIGPLIKEYQSEIDVLCNRCKYLETFILSKLTPLRDLPSIGTLLSKALAEFELMELTKSRLEKYEKEMSEVLKNRELEIVKPLEERISKLKVQNRDLENQLKKEIEALATIKSNHMQEIESLLKENKEKSHELLCKKLELQKRSSELEIKDTQWQHLERKLDQFQQVSKMDDSSVSEKIIASEKELQNAHALIQSLEKEKNSLNDNLELSKSILEQEKKEKIECMDTLNARIQQYLSILEIKDKELESLRTEIETVRKTHQERMDSNQERIAMLEGLLQGSNIPSLDNADSTLVNIYVSQRDRLKSKCNELEKHLVSKSQAYARLKNENELLQKENIAMFEKIEYLSGFPTHPLCAPSKMDSGCNLNLRSSSNTACDKIEKKYRELYEDKMHTFNEFSRREIHRKWRQLGLINQMSLRISNVLMKKSSFRKIFFAYMFFINSFALFLFIYLCVK